MVELITFLICVFGGFIAGLIIGIYVGFMTYNNDVGKIRRFYNDRERGENTITELKKKCKELEIKLNKK